MSKKATVQEEKLLLEVTMIKDEMYMTSGANWLELYSIVRHLVDSLATNAEDGITYNDILDSLKEVGMNAEVDM